MASHINCELTVHRSPAKPSRPARAYFHLTKPEYLSQLSDKIRGTTFNDAKASFSESVLSGPPSVEFAPYMRVPHGRPRKDARQGTIDMDQEFIDFLESLTNPVLKPFPVVGDNDVDTKKGEKITVTPLIQYLRDKKANNLKEQNAPPKPVKHARQDSKDAKDVKPSPSTDKKMTSSVPAPTTDKRSAQAIKVEKAARDAVRMLNKQANNVKKPTPSPLAATGVASTAAGLTPPSITASAVSSDKKRERGNVSAAARILQRDLGIGANGVRRGGHRDVLGGRIPNGNIQVAAKKSGLSSEAKTSTGTTSSSVATTVDEIGSAAETLNTTKDSGKPSNINSAITKNPPIRPTSSPNVRSPITNTGTPNRFPHPPAQKPAPTATQAFLKHANPSQGVTEPLLQEAFTTFGAIKKVEIDQRKGFAYVDFVEPQGLQNAIQGSPVKVAQGQVVVLERKSGPNLQMRNLRGGGAPMIGLRGHGIPMGPKGGRGSSMRGRGGLDRGPASTTPAQGSTTPSKLPEQSQGTPSAASVSDSATTSNPPLN